MVRFDLTEQEAAVLRQFIDVAVKALGIRGAEAGLYLDQKVAKAMESANFGSRPNGSDKTPEQPNP